MSTTWNVNQDSEKGAEEKRQEKGIAAVIKKIKKIKKKKKKKRTGTKAENPRGSNLYSQPPSSAAASPPPSLGGAWPDQAASAL